MNVASIAGVTGSISADVAGTGYGSAKHGVIGLTRTMALAYAKRNIRVNAVCPGYVKTGITEFLYEDPETSRRIISEDLRVPMDRWGEPREIGSVVAFLASDAASFITGQPIIVDGGIMARYEPLPPDGSCPRVSTTLTTAPAQAVPRMGLWAFRMPAIGFR